MKKLTEWMVRRFLPGYVLIVPDEAGIKQVIGEKLGGWHLHKSPPKGLKRSKSSD